MGFLLWWLLNAGLFTLFLVLCFHATKLIKGKFGTIVAIVFVLGLLSMTGSSDSSHDSINGEPKWKFISEDNIAPNTTRSFQLVLKKTPLAKHELGFVYGLHNQSRKLVPISAYSYTNGFISGTEWVPQDISITNTETDKRFKYSVQGVIKWKLLGTNLYTQPKEYSGTVEVK